MWTCYTRFRTAHMRLQAVGSTSTNEILYALKKKPNADIFYGTLTDRVLPENDDRLLLFSRKFTQQ